MRLSVCFSVSLCKYGLSFLYLPNDWTYFNETDHSYLLPGPRDTGDIEKVTGSKVRVTKHFPKIWSKSAEA